MGAMTKMWMRTGALAVMALAAAVVLALCAHSGTALGLADEVEEAASEQESSSSESAASSSSSSSYLGNIIEAILQERDEQLRAKEQRELEARQAASKAHRKRVASDRREAAERVRIAHEAAWREAFPTDNYANTLLIGDSIMQNATSALQAALPGVDISADAGRTLEKGGLVFEKQSADCGVLDHVRRDDGSHARYVIGTGNNEVSGMGVDAAEEIVGRLGPDKQIYFVTMCSMGNATSTQVTNESIRVVADEHDNVHVIDWYGLVADNPSEYLADGIHPRSSRLSDYAACIKEGLDVIY